MPNPARPARRFGPALAIAAALLFISPSLGAEPSSLPGLSRFTLDNGLELYVYEDHSLPLARIQLSFRAGALVQTQDTAGHFHLLEHLLFRGSSGAPAGAAALAAAETESPAAALERLGVVEWNGGTSAESLSFWLELPASAASEGIGVWAAAMRPEGFSPEAVSAEKAAVLEELEARGREPDAVYEAGVTRRLFSKYPWRRDPAGSARAVSAASPEGLARLKATWLVPNNAALFVGGDVDPEAIHAAAAAAFAGWKPGPDPRKAALPAHPKVGVPRPTFLVFPDSSLPEGLALVELRYRGPDLATDPEASYAADLWSALAPVEGGRFAKAIAAAVPGLYDPASLAAYYVSQREGGVLSVSAALRVEPGSSLAERVWAFKERVRGFEFNAMKTDDAYFSAAEYEAARGKLLEGRARALDTPSGLIAELSFWWSAASPEYFFRWPSALAATGRRELAAFLDAYMLKNLEVIALRMNPEDYEREKKVLSSGGFERVDAANAFWWR